MKTLDDDLKLSGNNDRWNPKDFGEIDPQIEETGQLLIPFYDPNEPPDPDDYSSIPEYEEAYETWASTGI